MDSLILGVFQPFLENVFNNLLHDFNLSIRLGCATAANLFFMQCRRHESLNLALSNWVPLLVAIACGIPKRHMIFRTTKLITFFVVIVGNGSASAYLVK